MMSFLCLCGKHHEYTEDELFVGSKVLCSCNRLGTIWMNLRRVTWSDPDGVYRDMQNKVTELKTCQSNSS